MGFFLSKTLLFGSSNKIRVPPRQTVEKTHKNRRSKTCAMNCQSSLTLKEKHEGQVEFLRNRALNIHKLRIKLNL
uniref:Uncharacterized protein n=1 Tax=Romanomermis culicivorax TaxID=13658 RepID=A0A915I2U4_ROMCU